MLQHNTLDPGSTFNDHHINNTETTIVVKATTFFLSLCVNPEDLELNDLVFSDQPSNWVAHNAQIVSNLN